MGRGDRQRSPDVIRGWVGARLHRHPGAARSPLSRPSWPDVIRPPSRTRSTRGEISRSGLVPRIKKPKKNGAPMLSNQTGFPVERASTVDANKLVCEIAVSGPPRT